MKVDRFCPVRCARSVAQTAYAKRVEAAAGPASLDSANRRRTLWTVITLTPSSSASRAYTTPGSEHANTILARTATRDPPPANARN